jgi:hypothetical protein
MVIGEAKTKTLQQSWKGNDSSHISFDLSLDSYSLSKIEKLRNGADLHLGFLFLFQASPAAQPSKIGTPTITIDYIIPKSDWIEKILHELKYKNVALVELPQLEYAKLHNAIDMLS